MKIAYISSIWFADVDMSYLCEAQKCMDITYFMIITNGKSVSCVNIEKAYPKSGLFPSDIYPELLKFKGCIDLSKTFIVNCNAKHSYGIGSVKPFLQLFSYLRNNHFDVIHITGHLFFHNFFLYYFRKKMIYTVHDPINHSGYKNKMTYITKKACIKLIPNLIVLNNAQVDEFIDCYSLSRKNIIVSRLSRYNVLNYITQETTEYKNYILFFGTINPYKGLEYLFPAMKLLHEKHSDVALVVAGAGKYYFDISEYKSLPYFRIINRFIEVAELASLIKNSRFVVVPYVDATQSGVIMSAFAFNKPCIVTNVGGLPEMVEDGIMGEVVPPKNIKALSEAMIRFIEQPQKLSEYSSNINKEYTDGYRSWKTIANEMKVIYSSI